MRYTIIILLFLTACANESVKESSHDRWCRMMDSSTEYTRKGNYILSEQVGILQAARISIRSNDLKAYKEQMKIYAQLDTEYIRLSRISKIYRDSAGATPIN